MQASLPKGTPSKEVMQRVGAEWKAHKSAQKLSQPEQRAGSRLSMPGLAHEPGVQLADAFERLSVAR